MKTLKKILKSRTVWTVAVLVVFNTISAVRDLVPAMYQPIVDSVLGLATIYFHVNPSQKY